jgi:hypothetical protein
MSRDERLGMCLERLFIAVWRNPNARLRYAQGTLTVLTEEASGCLSVLGVVDMNAPDATVKIANVLNRVRV